MSSEHFDVLDAQLDEIEQLDQLLREKLSGLPTLIRKAKARVRPARRDQEAAREQANNRRKKAQS